MSTKRACISNRLLYNEVPGFAMLLAEHGAPTPDKLSLGLTEYTNTEGGCNYRLEAVVDIPRRGRMAFYFELRRTKAEMEEAVADIEALSVAQGLDRFARELAPRLMLLSVPDRGWG